MISVIKANVSSYCHTRSEASYDLLAMMGYIPLQSINPNRFGRVIGGIVKSEQVLFDTRRPTFLQFAFPTTCLDKFSFQN